jgi:hypothetical protein
LDLERKSTDFERKQKFLFTNIILVLRKDNNESKKER